MCTERARRARRRSALAALTLVPLAACNGTTSYLDAQGASGHPAAVLGVWLTAISGAVVAIVCVAILAGIWRHRGEHNAPQVEDARAKEEHDGSAGSAAARREIRSGLRWIYIGIGATVVVLLLTFAGTMVTLDAASRPREVPSLTLDVTGHQWWWEVRYSDLHDPSLGFVTANEVHLPIGVPVRVRLHSADVIHSFWLPQIAGKTDVIPGQVNEMWLQADHAGTSRGSCAEYCGLGHAVMALAATAEAPAAFARWAAARRAEASPATTPALQAGELVFVRSCGACHAVAGTNALGRYGPDLTHLASRPSIGAGALANTPENLARWIRNAPALKEGSRMPALALDDADLRTVVAYLTTLR
jgi:cytochrome c oxidase subunit 2